MRVEHAEWLITVCKGPCFRLNTDDAGLVCNLVCAIRACIIGNRQYLLLQKFPVQEAELPASSASSVASPHASPEFNARQSMKAWRFEQPNLILDIQHGVRPATQHRFTSAM